MKLTVFLILFASAWALRAATFASDGSVADVQAKWNLAADGDTVTIPSGSFTWGSGLTLNGKGAKLKGQGSGRIVGRSVTTVTIGTGTKVFTTQSGLPLSAGQIVKVIHTANSDNYMDGTVSTYSGTSLTVSVSAVGSLATGTWDMWVIATNPSTTVTLNSTLAITEDTTHNVELSDFKLVVNSAASDGISIINNSGKPVLWHDAWISIPGSHRAMLWQSNRGVMWNCSIDAGFWSGMGGGGWQGKLLQHKSGGVDTWVSASTMGTADTTGENNFYIEDCDFHGMFLAALDMDDNSRSVVRYCLFNNSAFGTHGADTSNYGVRHIEIYNNQFVFTDAGVDTFNLANGFFYNRGGTGLIASNSIDDINSQEWSDKNEWKFQIQNLRRNAGPNPCWNSGYPAPRQIGMGRVTGSAGNDSITYKGDSEPFYVWGNTGVNLSANDPREDYIPDECGNGTLITTYLQPGRDYIFATKPGWTAYTYPHPLRGGGGGGGGQTVQNVFGLRSGLRARNR